MKFISEHDDQRILDEVAAKNPSFLIGGYNVDAIILAIWYELYEGYADSRLQREEIHERITKTLNTIYTGGV